jgi:alkylation response protein AidB-like acyl-CoA dehydrogenase
VGITRFRAAAIIPSGRSIIGTFLGEKSDPRVVAYLLVPLSEVNIVDDWQVLGLLGTGSKSLVLRDVFVPEHRSVMVSDLFAGTPPGALLHPDDPVLRAPRGFLVSYSLPSVAIALGRRALDIACATLATPGVTRGDPGRRIRGRADRDRRGGRDV